MLLVWMLPEYLEGLVTGPEVFLITILKAFKRVLGTRGLEPQPLSRPDTRILDHLQGLQSSYKASERGYGFQTSIMDSEPVTPPSYQ